MQTISPVVKLALALALLAINCGCASPDPLLADQQTNAIRAHLGYINANKVAILSVQAQSQAHGVLVVTSPSESPAALIPGPTAREAAIEAIRKSDDILMRPMASCTYIFAPSVPSPPAAIDCQTLDAEARTYLALKYSIAELRALGESATIMRHAFDASTEMTTVNNKLLSDYMDSLHKKYDDMWQMLLAIHRNLDNLSK